MKTNPVFHSLPPIYRFFVGVGFTAAIAGIGYVFWLLARDTGPTVNMALPFGVIVVGLGVAVAALSTPVFLQNRKLRAEGKPSWGLSSQGTKSEDDPYAFNQMMAAVYAAVGFFLITAGVFLLVVKFEQ